MNTGLWALSPFFSRRTNRRTAIRINAMSLKEREVWYQHLEVLRAKAEAEKRAQQQSGQGQQQGATDAQQPQEGAVAPQEAAPVTEQAPAPAAQH